MAKQLPFKTAPRQLTTTVGSPDIGELEFPVYGSLIWYEREALRKADNGFNLFRESALVAGPIARAEGISHVEAHNIVMRILSASLGVATTLSEQEIELRAKHSEALGQLVDAVLAWNERRQLAAVTAVIANRLPGCEDWTEEDTRRAVPEAMLAAIYAFVSREEAAQTGDGDAVEQERQQAEELGKSPMEHGNPPQNPTGSGSTGDLERSIPAPENSAQTALELTPSATSSAPSKRVRGKNANASTASS